MARVSFSVPGAPFGKERHRSTRQGRMYTPERTVAHEAKVGDIARPLFPTPLVGPVRLIVVAVFEPPKSWSKKRRAAAIGQPHTQKPDRSNIEKAVEDGLNGVAYQDDAQVAEGMCRKRWGERAETRVTVETLGPTHEAFL